MAGIADPAGRWGAPVPSIWWLPTDRSKEPQGTPEPEETIPKEIITMAPIHKSTPPRCLVSRLWLPAILVASNSHLRLLRLSGAHYGEILINSRENR
jgi:hypothetical protein